MSNDADRPKMTMRFERISPAKAEAYLAANIDVNRGLYDSAIDQMADDMRSGAWKTTHEGIAFDWDEALIDGQNRLHAIVRSGVTVELPVFRNCDPKTFDVINMGRVRSSNDLFTIAYKRRFKKAPVNASYITSVGTGMLSGLKSGHQRKTEASAHALKHHAIITQFLKALQGSPLFSTNFCAAFVNAALYYGTAPIVVLANRFRSEEWLVGGDQMKALHQGLLKASLRSRDNRAKRLTRGAKYGYCVAAIRAAMSKTQVTRIQGTTRDFGEAEEDRSYVFRNRVGSASVVVAGAGSVVKNREVTSARK
jgi:hypothetical protein